MARAVKAGDVVTIVRQVDDYAELYGPAARAPFTVDDVRRRPNGKRVQFVCAGGGMLVWRAFVKRVPRERRK